MTTRLEGIGNKDDRNEDMSTIEQRREYQRKKRARRKVFLNTLKVNGCSLCEEKHPATLDFHHRDPSSKEGTISDLIDTGSDEKFYAEVAKCIIICANCHRKQHYDVHKEYQLPDTDWFSKLTEMPQPNLSCTFCNKSSTELFSVRDGYVWKKICLTCKIKYDEDKAYDKKIAARFRTFDKKSTL